MMGELSIADLLVHELLRRTSIDGSRLQSLLIFAEQMQSMLCMEGVVERVQSIMDVLSTLGSIGGGNLKGSGLMFTNLNRAAFHQVLLESDHIF
jgi:hypothetical protein